MDPRTVDSRRRDVQLVDVREDDEWSAGRIAGARHIPLGELAGRLDELDRDRTVVTVCRSGGRAAKAADVLRGSGRPAEVLTGGIAAWAQAGLPVVTADGTPGHVA